jgi:hypothetical protein
MQPLLSLASAAKTFNKSCTFKKSRLFAVLKGLRDTVMGPIDRLAKAVDVADVLTERERAADASRGLAPPADLKRRPLMWLVQLHWQATAPKRRVFRLFESLNHLS